VAAVIAVPVVVLVVLAVEVELAQRAPTLEDGPLELGGRVGPAGPGPVLRVAWLGDSTAAGVGASGRSGALPVQVAEGLGPPVELIVLATSGARIADVVDDQLPALAGLDPEAVFVSVGANDTVHFTGRRSFERRYRTLVEGLPEDARVVLLGVPDMGSIPRLAQPLRAVAGWRGRQLDGVVREVAAATGASYVDIAGATGPAFRADPDRFYAGDDYHPSDEGYRRWAEAVLDVVGSAMLGG
ncbi:MAG: SGNH/GDSL hydrolase family protein, partial [Actinobacteria bacterium]|nr:SGNH/GDSL hydrolase family protein [Actinomycetota bacterium]